MYSLFPVSQAHDGRHHNVFQVPVTVFLCTGHWPVSHIHSCGTWFAFRKRKGRRKGGKHLWLLCEQEWAQSLPLCLWNENDAWLISMHLTEVSWRPCRCRRAGLIKTKFLGLYTTERITYVLGRETKCFCSQWREGSERSSPGALHLLLRDVPAPVANVLTIGEGRLTAFLGPSLVLKSERFCWFGFKGCFITSELTIHSKYAYILSDIDYIIRYAALTIQT